jgi:hypothetical protein
MSKPAALSGTFSDFRIVRGRKVAQILVEIPVERADEALRVLGGIPQPHTERWVAIARLEPDMKADAEPKPRRKLHEMSLAQQAALLCNDQAFQQFIVEEYNAADAAAWVRDWCGVKSRADILPDTEAAQHFKQLRDDFYLWRDSPDFYDATREAAP